MRHIAIILSFFLFAPIMAQERTCLSDDEMQLYKLIMEYRVQKKLPEIPLSASLTTVAQIHAKDLHQNRPFTKKCNMHSWSKKGNWKACCYTDDHKKAECMWDKPRELTVYKGDGYEIAHGYSSYDTYPGVDVTPETALQGWKQSKGHNMVIINKGTWKDVQWKAIGIGIYKDFAVVWFGTEDDPAGKAVLCSE